MSATDELRSLLDERGVEWWNETDPEPQEVTMARVGEQLIEYHENANGSTGYHIFNMHDLTPEQAVEATLGRGTCRMETFIYEDTGAFIECSECGWQLFDADYSIDAACEWLGYCPCCGRKVVGA